MTAATENPRRGHRHGRQTAVQGADPNCPVCLGTGTDLVFESGCTNCWDTSTEDLNDTRHLLAMRYIQSEQREAAFEASHERQLATRNDRWERHLKAQYRQPGEMPGWVKPVALTVAAVIVVGAVIGFAAGVLFGFEGNDPPQSCDEARAAVIEYGTGPDADRLSLDMHKLCR